MTVSNDLVESARAAARGRDESRLRDLAREALALRAPQALDLVHIGITLRDAFLFDLSDTLFARAFEIEPAEVYPRYEHALSLSMQQRHRDGAALLESVLADRPEDTRSALLLLRLCCLIGDRTRADMVVRNLPMTSSNLREVRYLRAFADFIEEFPWTRTEALVGEVERRYRRCNHFEVMDELHAAKLKRAPYALLRLGDGEGSYTRLDLLDEARFADLYADSRRQFYEIWFGTAADAYSARFDKEVRSLARVLTESDLLGLPVVSWVRHEYTTGSPRGVSTLTNIYRFLSSRETGPTRVCSQMIHLDLGQAKFFSAFLEGESIGLLSCFPQLPDKLRRNFGVRSVDFYKLPGEQSFKHIIGEEAAQGFHYPDVFERVMADLVGDHHGKIFLVAGGILGKLYAGQIRRHGGIAIDIGSLADAWAHKMTRPGYEDLTNLALS